MFPETTQNSELNTFYFILLLQAVTKLFNLEVIGFLTFNWTSDEFLCFLRFFRLWCYKCVTSDISEACILCLYDMVVDFYLQFNSCSSNQSLQNTDIQKIKKTAGENTKSIFELELI